MATDRSDDNTNTGHDRNPDAITGAPGSHPVGTGVGAAGGGAAGAAIGAAVSGPAAPIGAVIGAVVGAVAGGLAGKGAAEAVNPTAEDEYWRANHANRPYVEPSFSYDEDYRPAYQHGWQSRGQHQGRKFDEVESDLGRSWENTKGKSRLGWDKAKHAARDAWNRLDDDNRASDANYTGTAGAAQAYPGHTDDRGSFPSSEATTGRTSGGDLGSGFSGTRTAGMDDRTGGLMGTQIGGNTDVDYDDFARSSRQRYQGRNFDDVENDLRTDWSSRRSGSSGGSDTWDNVRDRVRSAWHKVERAMPGDADRDGR